MSFRVDRIGTSLRKSFSSSSQPAEKHRDVDYLISWVVSLHTEDLKTANIGNTKVYINHPAWVSMEDDADD